MPKPKKTPLQIASELIFKKQDGQALRTLEDFLKSYQNHKNSSDYQAAITMAKDIFTRNSTLAKKSHWKYLVNLIQENTTLAMCKTTAPVTVAAPTTALTSDTNHLVGDEAPTPSLPAAVEDDSSDDEFAEVDSTELSRYEMYALQREKAQHTYGSLLGTAVTLFNHGFPPSSPTSEAIAITGGAPQLRPSSPDGDSK